MTLTVTLMSRNEVPDRRVTTTGDVRVVLTSSGAMLAVVGGETMTHPNLTGCKVEHEAGALPPAAVKLLDDAFQAAHNWRGTDPEARKRRKRVEEWMNALLEMASAVTGRDMEAIFEEFDERLTAAVESRVQSEG